MYQYFTHGGEHYVVDFYDAIKAGEKTETPIEQPYYKTHNLLVKYQPQKSPHGKFGYYVNLPIAGGKKKKLYIDFK